MSVPEPSGPWMSLPTKISTSHHRGPTHPLHPGTTPRSSHLAAERTGAVHEYLSKPVSHGVPGLIGLKRTF